MTVHSSRIKEILYVAKIPEYATVNSRTSSQVVLGPCNMANHAIKGGMNAYTMKEKNPTR